VELGDSTQVIPGSWPEPVTSVSQTQNLCLKLIVHVITPRVTLLFILRHFLRNFQRWNFERNLFITAWLHPTNHNILYLTTLSVIDVLYKSGWKIFQIVSSLNTKFFLYTIWNGIGGSGGIAPMILNFDISWRWAVIVMPLPLYSRWTNTTWIRWSTGRLAGPRIGLNFLFCRRQRLTAPLGIRNSDCAGCSQVIYRLNDSVS
jgi:hypothetical protein